MMKYLLMFVVLGVAVLWWFKGSGRGGNAAPGRTPREPAQPMPMVACAHCGVHLPQADAVADAQRRPFCSEAHRLAGPR